ncbi:MAG: tetratricopeptide repeat protein [Cyanobacteria bacterium P01_A01_bin.123]
MKRFGFLRNLCLVLVAVLLLFGCLLGHPGTSLAAPEPPPVSESVSMPAETTGRGVPLYPYSSSLWDKFEQLRNDPQLQKLVEEDLEKSLVIREVIQTEVDRTFSHTTTLLNVLLVVLTAIPILTAVGFWFIRRSVINQIVVETRKQLQDEVRSQFRQEVSQEITAQTDAFKQEIKQLRDEFAAQLQQLNVDAQQEKDQIIQELTTILPPPIRDSASPELQQKLQTLTKQLQVLKSANGKLKFSATDYLEQGKAFYFEEVYKDAIAAFDQALNLSPKNAKALFYKGLSLAKLQQYGDALNCYEIALAIAPESPEIWLSKGSVLVRQQQLSEAIASYDQATCLNPDFYQAWFGKARSYALQGEPDLALEALEKAIAINAERCIEAAKTDAAFDELRDSPSFIQLVA